MTIMQDSSSVHYSIQIPNYIYLGQYDCESDSPAITVTVSTVILYVLKDIMFCFSFLSGYPISVVAFCLATTSSWFRLFCDAKR